MQEGIYYTAGFVLSGMVLFALAFTVYMDRRERVRHPDAPAPAALGSRVEKGGPTPEATR